MRLGKRAALPLTQLALLAQLQSDQLSEKMRDTRLAEARQGRLVGPVPVGYERRDGRLVPTQQADALRLAFQLLCTGDYGVQRITKTLNEAGHVMPDGSPFKVTGVEEMLKNPVYAGFVTCVGQIFPGNHEPIIDLATWEHAQEITQQRSFRRPRPDAPKEPLLSGLAMCPYCGAPMWHFPRADRRYYRCCTVPTRRPGPIADLICGDTYAYAETLEELVLTWIGALPVSPEVFERARRRYNQPVARQAVVDDAELRKLKQAFLAERISAADYEVQRAALLTGGTAGPDAEQLVDVEVLLQVLRDLPAVLAEATQAERRTALRQLVTEIYAKRDRLLAFRPTRLAEGLLLAVAESDEWLRKVVESGPGGDRTDDIRFKRPSDLHG